MKILFIGSCFNALGGIQRYTKDVLQATSEAGHTVHCSTLQSTSLISKMFFLVDTLRKTLITHPDLIICGHIQFSPLCLGISKLLRIRYIILTYGIDVWEKKKSYVSAIQCASSVVTISEFTKKRLIAAYNPPDAKIILLSPCVRKEEFFIKQPAKDLSLRLNIQEKDFVLLTVCRLSSSEQYKGYDIVLSALARLKMKNYPLKYLIIGNGDDERRVRELISSLKLNNIASIHTSISNSELLDIYNLSNVFVMPSRGEGFGIVFIEALACGVPVITGNADASPEAIAHGKLGIAIDPMSVSDTAMAIEKFYTKNISKNLFDPQYLRNTVLEYFGYEVFKKRVNDLLAKK